MESHKIYERTIRADTEDSLSRIAALIEPRTVLLDVGCSSGMLGRFLVQEKGCIIDGVDIERPAVENCRGIYRRVAILNVETAQLTECFGEERYDYIVVADVVEHLVDATFLFNQLKLLIKPNGTIYFSIPNITHIASAFQLLLGDFSYKRSGLLDSTHLRFFSRESFVEKLKENGIYCWNILRVERGVDDTEFGDALSLLFPQDWLRQIIADRPDSLAYQWIFEARIFPPSDQLPAQALPVGSRLIPLLSTCLYWDDGQGFAEERKLMGFAESANGLDVDARQLAFLLDEVHGVSLSRLRIDPFLSPQWMKVCAAWLSDETGNKRWCWIPGQNDGILNNACWVGEGNEGRTLISDHADPHWIPDIPRKLLASVGRGWRFSMLIIGQSQMYSGEVSASIEREREAVLSSALEIRKLREGIAELEASRAALNGRLSEILGSRSWRMTKPLRRLSVAVRPCLSKGLFALKRAVKAAIPGQERYSGILQRRGPHRHEKAAYSEWINKNEPSVTLAIRDCAGKRCPLISIVMPTFNTPAGMLEKAIMSVREQDYPHWELCVADDASSAPEVREVIGRHMATDRRIRAVFREQNGHIVEATTSALALVTGDFVGFLDHDDQLAVSALSALVQEIYAHPGVDMLYTDEDKLSEEGARSDPFFKPDWSPHLAISQAYLGHFVCYRTELIRQIGGLRPGVDGAQDYDLWLRAANCAREIRHLPKVLYHWRMHSGSTAASGDAKPYAHEAGRKAVNDYLHARYPSTAVEAVDGEYLFTYRAKFSLPEDTLVSIVIPTKDRPDLLETCVRGILEKSTWKNFEIIVIDNNSTEVATFGFFEQIKNEDSRVNVISMPIPFNWSRLNNLAIQQAKGGVFVFLNNDTEIISSEWIESLAGYALLPDVGVVGGLLLFDDGTIQHSGVVVGMHGWAEHVFKGQKPVHSISPFVSPVLSRNVLAVTGACMAVSREKFVALGGFDEEFEICGSDVELGIRAHKRGLYNVLCAEARLYHYESKTRDAHVPENDFMQSDKKYYPFRKHSGDPFFSKNLSLRSTSPELS